MFLRQIRLQMELYAEFNNGHYTCFSRIQPIYWMYVFIKSVLFNQIIGGTSNLGVGVFAVLSTIGIQCRLPACPIGKHLPYTTLPPILVLGEEKEKYSAP